ncbi:EAL domain-containing protein [Ningiella sp. W23]|uniref:EAL domain-containing protein n=1 Tax=Ningiella sp. W23 TaxID=3023715 RepID=UPI0037583AEE
MAASIAVLLFSIVTHEKLFTESTASDLNGLAVNIANDLMLSMTSDEPNLFAIKTTLLKLDPYQNVKYAAVLDTEGAIVDKYRGTAQTVIGAQRSVDEQVVLDTFNRSADGVTINEQEVIAKVLIGDKTLSFGYLLIVNDLSAPMNESKSELLSTVAPLMIIVIALGGTLSMWLNQQFLSPFRQLASFAKRIKSTNDYSIDVNVSGKKEVQDLSAEFSSMMQTIYTTETKNKLHAQRLEDQREQMEYLANYDELTGLMNRQCFVKELKKDLSDAKIAGSNPILFYVDLDEFKGINDSHGHHIGDKLLKSATSRMEAVLSSKVKLCRFGGDEFLIEFPEGGDIDFITHNANTIINALSKSFSIEQWEVEISASIGVSCAKGSDYELEKFLTNSDMAMYAAKARGKNTFVIFDDSMSEQNLRNLQIAGALTTALKNKDFSLYYQPKVNSQHVIVGFEGLIRWIHDDLGFVPPDEFILIAEKTGKINQITHFVIEQACKDIGALTKQFGENIVLSVNLSSHDLRQASLSSFIKKTFIAHNVSPHNIEFEVTESAYLENFEEANRFFHDMSELGCSIALDDFGTGYSSLSYLTKIDVDTLKIDKEFIDKFGTSKRDTLVTKSIIQLAKQLNLKICAEGVETKQQAKLLLDEGCDQLQGYYFKKPSPLLDLMDIEQAV